MGSVLDAIYARRSVRRFLPDPVADQALVELARAGAAAPSAHNQQPWEFVLVTDPEVLAAMRTIHQYCNYNAPAAIAVCGHAERFMKGIGADFWIQDCSAAMENILLAATELGLGSVWMGMYPIEKSVATLRSILHLPETVIPLGLAFIGYPSQQPEPRTQLREDQVHWQRY